MMSSVQIEREKWVLRYLSALDDGDANGILRVLKHAENDLVLSQMIAEVHTIHESDTVDALGNYQSTPFLQPEFSPNISPNGKRESARSQVHYKNRYSRGVLRGYLSTGIVAILSLVLIGVILFTRQSSSTGLSLQDVDLDSLQSINANNITDLQQLTVLGNGAINDAIWSPNGETIAIATTRGIYLHSADDLSLEPILLGGQVANMSSVEFTPDGTAIAGTTGNRAVLWSAQTGEVLREFAVTDALSVDKVMIKADGTAIAVVACMVRNENRACDPDNLIMWDITTGDILNTFTVRSAYFPVLNHDWTLIADTGEEWGDVDIYDVATGEVLTTLTDDEVMLTVFEFNPDGDGFFVIGWDSPEGGSGQVMLWNIDDLLEENVMYRAEPIAQISNDRMLAQQLIFETTGTRLFTMSYSSVHMWDWENDIVRTIVSQTETSSLSKVVARPDGEQIMTVGDGGILQIWEVESGEQLSQSLRYGGHYSNLDFHPNLPYLTASHGYNAPSVVRLWDISQNSITEQIITGNEDGLIVYDGALSPDGETFAYLGSEQQRVWLRDVATGEERQIINSANGGVAYANDGTLLSLYRVGRIGYTGALIYRLPPNADEPTQIQISGDFFEYVNGHSFTFSPDGRLLAVLACEERQATAGNFGTYDCLDSQVRLYDAVTGKWVGNLADSNKRFDQGGLAFSPDGNFITLNQCTTTPEESTFFRGSCEAYEVVVWNISEVYPLLGQPMIDDEDGENPMVISSAYRVEIPPNDYTYQMVYPPRLLMNDDDLLLFASDDDQVFIWSLANNDSQLLHSINASGYSLALNIDNTLLAIGTDGTVSLWGIPQ